MTYFNISDASAHQLVVAFDRAVREYHSDVQGDTQMTQTLRRVCGLHVCGTSGWLFEDSNDEFDLRKQFISRACDVTAMHRESNDDDSCAEYLSDRADITAMHRESNDDDSCAEYLSDRTL